MGLSSLEDTSLRRPRLAGTPDREAEQNTKSSAP